MTRPFLSHLRPVVYLCHQLLNILVKWLELLLFLCFLHLQKFVFEIVLLLSLMFKDLLPPIEIPFPLLYLLFEPLLLIGELFPQFVLLVHHSPLLLVGPFIQVSVHSCDFGLKLLFFLWPLLIQSCLGLDILWVGTKGLKASYKVLKLVLA